MKMSFNPLDATEIARREFHETREVAIKVVSEAQNITEEERKRLLGLIDNPPNTIRVSDSQKQKIAWLPPSEEELIRVSIAEICKVIKESLGIDL